MKTPALNQLNIVAGDFDAALAFYRRLGPDIREHASHGDIRHAEVTLPNGLILEFDSQALARTYNAAWRRPGGSSAAIVADPAGNDVGLMSPIDEGHRHWPPTDSPDR